MDSLFEILGPLLIFAVIAILNVVKQVNDRRMKKEQKEVRDRRASEGGNMQTDERARRQMYGDAIPTAKRRGGQPSRQEPAGSERAQRQQSAAMREEERAHEAQRRQAQQQEEARRQAAQQATRNEELRRMQEAAGERHESPQNLDPRQWADRPVLREAGQDVRELFDDLMGREKRAPAPPQETREKQSRPPASPQEQKRQERMQRRRQHAQKQQRGREERRRKPEITPAQQASRQTGMPSISETAMDRPGGARKLRDVQGDRAAQRIGASGLFPDRDALRQAIIMTEVLGPPRAEKELSETRNWS